MRIEHIALYVDDLERARLELVHRPEITEAPRAAGTGYAHIAFSAGSRFSENSAKEYRANFNS